MYRKILLAYDGSTDSEIALGQAVSIAGLCQAELQLLGIVAIHGYAGMAGELGSADLWTMEQKQLEAALEAAIEDLAKRGVKATFSIREGNPAAEISAYAQEMGADLVVLGHSDKGMFIRWFEGSVGAGLLRDLPCSLLVAT